MRFWRPRPRVESDRGERYVLLGPDAVAQLVAVADRDGITVVQAADRAIAEYAERHETGRP